MEQHPADRLAEILKEAQRCGLAHNNGAGGQYVLCATEAQLLAFDASIAKQQAQVPAAQSGGEVAGWQMRTKFQDREWSRWSECSDCAPDEPREMVAGPLTMQFRPLYLTPPSPQQEPTVAQAVPASCPTYQTTSGDTTVCKRCGESWRTGYDRACVHAAEVLARATPSQVIDKVDAPLAPILDEVEKAVRKFPTWPTDPLHALAVLGEEFGELTKDVLQLTYEPTKTNADNLRKEAIQTAAMALRFFVSLDRYEFAPSAQHEQPAFIRAAIASTREGQKP